MRDSRNPNVTAVDESRRAARSTREQVGVVETVNDGVVRLRLDDNTTVEAALPLHLTGTPTVGDLARFRERANGVPTVTDIETQNPDYAPTTIAEYAAYWNNADPLIAADDARSHSIAVSSRVIENSDITVKKAATLLANDVIPDFAEFTVSASTTVSLLYSTYQVDNQLSVSNGLDIVQEGQFSWNKVGAAFYGAGQQSQLLSTSDVASLVTDTSVLSDGNMAKALTPFTDTDGSQLFADNKTVKTRLDTILDDPAIDDSRLSTLYATGKYQSYGNLDSTFDDDTGKVWAIIVSAWDDPGTAATAIENGPYSTTYFDWMWDYIDFAKVEGWASYADFAAIWNHSNLSIAVGAEKFGQTGSNNGGAFERASMFEQPEMSVARMAALWNEVEAQDYFAVGTDWEQVHDQNDARQKLADAIDHSNLTEANAESAWSDTGNLSDSEKANITEKLSDVDKPLTFGEQWYHRTVSAPSFRPTGIGGDENTVWHCEKEFDSLYELDSADFSTVRSTSAPQSAVTGIGGDSNTIWHCEGTNNRVYELDTADFSVIRSESAGTAKPKGIGGNSNIIWFCEQENDTVKELDTSDFSVIQSTAAPSTTPQGIGGDGSTVWHTDQFDGSYELDPSDLSVIRSASTPGADAFGTGGNGSVIWHCDDNADEIYRLSTG